MGLDIVEFVMQLEDNFALDIPDEHGGEIRTIGDVLSYLRGRLAPRAGDKCANQVVFHRLRGVLSPTHVRRSAFRTETPLDAVMSLAEWRSRWTSIGDAIGLAMPSMEVPVWTSLSMGLAGGIAGAWAFGPTAGLATAIAGALVGGAAGVKLGVPREANIAALVWSITARNYGALLKEGTAWRDLEAFAVIREIAADQFGAPLERIVADTRLADLAPNG